MVFKKHRRGQTQADRERKQRLTVSVAQAVKKFNEQEAQAQAQDQAATAQAQAATAQAQVTTAQVQVAVVAVVTPFYQPWRTPSSCDMKRTPSGNGVVDNAPGCNCTFTVPRNDRGNLDCRRCGRGKPKD